MTSCTSPTTLKKNVVWEEEDPREPTTEYEDFRSSSQPRRSRQSNKSNSPNLPWLMEYWSSSLLETPVLSQLLSCGSVADSTVKDNDGPSAGKPASWRFDLENKPKKDGSKTTTAVLLDSMEATTNVERLRAMVASRDQTFDNDEIDTVFDYTSNGSYTTASPYVAHAHSILDRMDDDDDDDEPVIMVTADSVYPSTKNVWREGWDVSTNKDNKHPYIPPIRRSSILHDDDDDDDDDTNNELDMSEPSISFISIVDDDEEQRDAVLPSTPKTMELYDHQHVSEDNTKLPYHGHNHNRSSHLNEPTSGWNCTKDEAMWLGGGQYLSRCNSFDTDMMMDVSRKMMDCSRNSNTNTSIAGNVSGRRQRSMALFSMMNDDSTSSASSRRYRRAQATAPPPGSPSDQTYTTVSLTQSYMTLFDEDDDDEGDETTFTPNGDGHHALTARPIPFRTSIEAAGNDPFMTPVRTKGDKKKISVGVNRRQLLEDCGDSDSGGGGGVEESKEMDMSDHDDDDNNHHEAFRCLIRMKPSNYRHHDDYCYDYEDVEDRISAASTSTTTKDTRSIPMVGCTTLPPSLPMLP